MGLIFISEPLRVVVNIICHDVFFLYLFKQPKIAFRHFLLHAHARLQLHQLAVQNILSSMRIGMATLPERRLRPTHGMLVLF